MVDRKQYSCAEMVVLNKRLAVYNDKEISDALPGETKLPPKIVKLGLLNNVKISLSNKQTNAALFANPGQQNSFAMFFIGIWVRLYYIFFNKETKLIDEFELGLLYRICNTHQIELAENELNNASACAACQLHVFLSADKDLRPPGHLWDNITKAILECREKSLSGHTIEDFPVISKNDDTLSKEQITQFRDWLLAAGLLNGKYRDRNDQEMFKEFEQKISHMYNSLTDLNRKSLELASNAINAITNYLDPFPVQECELPYLLPPMQSFD
jgi:hypothetical protein